MPEFAQKRPPSFMSRKEETSFFLRNLFRGIIWLTVLVVAYILIKRNVEIDYINVIQPLWDKPVLIYGIFTASEILIGIIPPEIFMMLSAERNILTDYVSSIIILSFISYLAGFAGYWIGIYFNHTKYYRFLKRRFFGKYEKYLNKFGVFLIIVASLTPLPFSGIAMLVGSVRYPMKKYLIYSSFRFLRFAAYSYIIWQAHSL